MPIAGPVSHAQLSTHPVVAGPTERLSEMDFVDNLAREMGWTRREVIESLNVLEEHNAITTLRSEHGVAGVWLNALGAAVKFD